MIERDVGGDEGGLSGGDGDGAVAHAGFLVGVSRARVMPWVERLERALGGKTG